MLRSLFATALLGTVLGLATAGQPDKPPATSDLTRLAEGVKKKIGALEAEIKELRNGNSLTDAERKKLDSLVYDLGKVQLELEEMRKEHSAINDGLKKQGEDIKELKKAQDKQKAELNKLDAGKIKEIEDALTEFKAPTRMIEHRRGTRTGTESWIELEAEVDGKKIPLGNKKVTVFRRFKDGPLTPFAEVVTDKNGIAVVTEPVVAGQAGPLYLVFQFAGDERYRKCEGKTHIK